MAKNKLTFVWVFALLVLSLTAVNAASSANNFTISLDGLGTSTNPVTGASGNDVSFTVNFETTNESYQSGLDLNWSGVDLGSGEVYNVGNTSFSSEVLLDGTTGSHYLNVDVSDNATGDLITSLSLRVYYATTSEPNSSAGESNSTGETNYCSDENYGELKIEKIDFDLVEGVGDDKDGFYTTDEIEISFRVKNDGEWDIKDIELLMCIYDVDDGTCIYDEDDFDLSDDNFDVDEGDKLEVTATIELDPNDFEEGSNNFIFWVSATGEIDDSDSDYDEELTCASDKEEIEIVTDDSFVIINDISIDPKTASAGTYVDVSAKVWNVGDEDLDDDEVYVYVYSKALNISETFEFDNGIDYFDYEKLEFSFYVPRGLDEKTYEIEFTAYEDEDMSDKDIFESKNDEEAIYSGYLTIEGSSTSYSRPTITPTKLSDAKVGEELTIQVEVTNNDEDGTYSISVDGYSAWADLVSITPASFSLDSKESGTAIVKLLPKTSGVQTLTVKTSSNGESTTQVATVTVAEVEETGFFATAGNTALYTISGFAAVLILLLLALIVRISRRSSKASISEF